MRQLISYIRNGTKTEQHHYESVWNMRSGETAYDEMVVTKERLGKCGGVQAFHFMQSFKPDEITPETAQEVGREFARRLLGNEYEAIITTHTDKKHIHNHICVNSVNRITGNKYRSQKQDMKRYRNLSDEICREYGLSVIEPKRQRGMSYAEWDAEKNGKKTIRGQIREDMNFAIRHAIGFGNFLSILEDMGYKTKQGKVWSVKAPCAERFVRIDTLGDLFTKEAIERRIEESFRVPKPPKTYPKKTYCKKSSYEEYGFWLGLLATIIDTFEPETRKYQDPTVELAEAVAGLVGVIFQILLDLLIGVEHRLIPPHYCGYLREEMTKFDKYVAQYEFLAKHHLNTTDDIWKLHFDTRGKIAELEIERKTAEPERKKEINGELKTLRKISKECTGIISTTHDVFVKLKRIALIELEKENERATKAKRHENER